MPSRAKAESCGSIPSGAAPACSCEACGLTFAEFRKSGLMGCSACYKAFESQVGPLIERAHEGGTHHIGKIPRRAGASVERQERITLLRRQLSDAIEAEQYERAADLRDQIRRFEEGGIGERGLGRSGTRETKEQR